MMSRSVAEWIGANPDADIPPRVRLRVFRKHDGNCASCMRPLLPGHWACDHIIALANGGEHREQNLQPLCDSPCHSQKTRNDVAEKSRVYKRAASHAGIKLRKSRPLPGSKASGIKIRMNGQVERRT